MSNAAPAKDQDTVIRIKGDLTPVGLKLPSTISFDEWQTVGTELKRVRGASQWAIGDWLVHGEHVFGEKYAQASDVTGMSPESLQVYQWVSSRVPMEIRREDVSHAHHQALGKLEPDEIQRWLERVAKKGMSVGELRAALREKRAKQAKKEGDTESSPKFKVSLVFEDDPGEEFLGRLEAYVNREGGTIKKAGW